MASDQKSEDKKEFTGILDLAPLEATSSDTPVPGTEEHNQETPVEKVDSFETLTDLGMMDHSPDQTFSGTPPGAETSISPILPNYNDMTSIAAPPTNVLGGFQSLEGSTEMILPETVMIEKRDSLGEATSSIDKIKDYAENAQQRSTEADIPYPFHFYAEGTFGYFERDKLLRFITENAVGITSAEIDLQIQAGRVLIPRISEYAGIKLVQELRDTPLKLKLTPSNRDSDEISEDQTPVKIQFDAKGSGSASALAALPVFDSSSPERKFYQEFDHLQATQYLNAEMVEAEKSELFQELLARMTDSLKIKARHKGADAITKPDTQVIALRLPSQYQIILSTSLLKRKLGTP